jgi:hypothetical protein
MSEGHRNPCEEGQLHANFHIKGSSNMSSSIYQKRKEEIKWVHIAMANEVGESDTTTWSYSGSRVPG